MRRTSGNGRSDSSLGVVTALLAGLAIAYGVTEPTRTEVFPAVLGVTCVAGAARLFFRSSSGIWNPMFWFLVASAVYYGFGPLLYVYGDPLILEYMDAYYSVNAEALHRTNLLNAVSVTSICLAYEIALRFVPRRQVTREIAPERLDGFSVRVLVLFAAIGYGARALVFLSRVVMGEGAVMFGILFSLSELTKVALLVATFRLAMRYRAASIPFLLFASVEMYLAVGSLMKQEVLEVLFVMFLGVYLARPSKKLAFTAMPIAIATYLVLMPVFSRARLAWGDVGRSAASAGVASALAEIGSESAAARPQFWWARLSQPAAQAFAMDSYDDGRAGGTFDVALLTFIPRAVWPDKPIITFGGDFTSLVTGSDAGGGTGPGFFGEAYWNYGWPGVLLMAAITGLAYAYFSQRNAFQVSKRDLRWLPIAYLSLKMGYRPDDWFVATMVGTVPIMIAIWIVLYPMTSGFTRPRTKEMHPRPA